MEKALHDLVVQVEVLDQKETALGIFLDTKGAFITSLLDSTCTAPGSHLLGHTTVLWIKATWRAVWPWRLSMSHL